MSSIDKFMNHLDLYPDDTTNKEIVIVGGGAVGLDVAEYFSKEYGESITIAMIATIKIATRIFIVLPIVNFILLFLQSTICTYNRLTEFPSNVDSFPCELLFILHS